MPGTGGGLGGGGKGGGSGGGGGNGERYGVIRMLCTDIGPYLPRSWLASRISEALPLRRSRNSTTSVDSAGSDPVMFTSVMTSVPRISHSLVTSSGAVADLLPKMTTELLGIPDICASSVIYCAKKRSPNPSMYWKKPTSTPAKVVVKNTM